MIYNVQNQSYSRQQSLLLLLLLLAVRSQIWYRLVIKCWWVKYMSAAWQMHWKKQSHTSLLTLTLDLGGQSEPGKHILGFSSYIFIVEPKMKILWHH